MIGRCYPKHRSREFRKCLDQVERFLALLTEKQLRRGVHRSTQQLEHDIRAFIDAHNADPKPFRWTKSADDIRAAIQRRCQRTVQSGRITESGHWMVSATGSEPYSGTSERPGKRAAGREDSQPRRRKRCSAADGPEYRVGRDRRPSAAD